MNLVIDLDGHRIGDRYKVKLGEEKSLDDSMLIVDTIKIKMKRGMFKDYEYIELEDFIKYVFSGKELKDALQRLLQIENTHHCQCKEKE